MFHNEGPVLSYGIHFYQSRSAKRFTKPSSSLVQCVRHIRHIDSQWLGKAFNFIRRRVGITPDDYGAVMSALLSIILPILLAYGEAPPLVAVDATHRCSRIAIPSSRQTTRRSHIRFVSLHLWQNIFATDFGIFSDNVELEQQSGYVVRQCLFDSLPKKIYFFIYSHK